MINSNFEFITSLQYRVKSLTAQVDAFESGEKYAAMRSEFSSQLSVKDRAIRKLKQELADAHCQTVTVRNYWSQVMDDIEKEHEKELQKKKREIESL
jgi:sugar-specific transcriptional regulator TrmB